MAPPPGGRGAHRVGRGRERGRAISPRAAPAPSARRTSRAVAGLKRRRRLRPRSPGVRRPELASYSPQTAQNVQFSNSPSLGLQQGAGEGAEAAATPPSPPALDPSLQAFSRDDDHPGD